MNHIVILDASAGELEKILSGVKTMILNEINPSQTVVHPVRPGDSLYFLRDRDDCTVRVKATALRVQYYNGRPDEDLSQILKEIQSRLQLTEEQYNCWSEKKQAVLVEFEGAQKITVMHVAPDKISGQSDWIAFEELTEII